MFVIGRHQAVVKQKSVQFVVRGPFILLLTDFQRLRNFRIIKKMKP